VPRGEMPPSGPPPLAPHAGVDHLGIPVGSCAYVQLRLQQLFDKKQAEIKKVHDRLGDAGLPQEQWLMLHFSSQFLIDYLLQHCRPDDTAVIAGQFDRLMETLVSDLLKTDISGLEAGSTRMRLPVKLNGLGIRSRVELAPAAFAGALVKALPSIIDSADAAGIPIQGILNHPDLRPIIGPQSFACGHYDLSTFVNSGSPDGAALNAAWRRLQVAATIPGAVGPSSKALAVPVAQSGEGIQNLQHAITTALDRARHARLLHAANRNTRNGRAVLTYDRLSRAFLRCPPRDPYKLSPEEFSEALCRFMCAPSPACAPLIGTLLRASARGGPIDLHGDIMLNACLTGDPVTRLRHDPVKFTIAQHLRECGSFVRVEAFDFFASVIPAANLSLLDQEPHRDARKRLPTPDIVAILGPRGREQVIEIKSIALNETWYSQGGDPSGPNYGTAKRASAVQRELQSKVRALDLKLRLVQPAVHGAPPPAPGPCERKLQASAPVTAVCVGGLGEGSPDLHSLIHRIAEVTAAKMKDELGMEYRPAKARVTEYLYRDLGTVIARGMARMILDGRQFAHPLLAQHLARIAAGPAGAFAWGRGGTIGPIMGSALVRMGTEEGERRGGGSGGFPGDGGGD
jgi:hypothetical protein